MTLKKIGAKLSNMGYNWEYIPLIPYGRKYLGEIGIMVETPDIKDYNAVYSALERVKNIDFEPRGYRTAVMIWEV